MVRFYKVGAVFLVAILGLWGCSRGPASSTEGGRIRSLEDKNARLEEDYKSASSARDQFRKRLGMIEQANAQLQHEIEQLRAATAKERDELQVALKSRTLERDQLQTQYDGFRKNLRDLLGQAEASLGRPGNEVTAVSHGPALSPAPAKEGLHALAGGIVGPMMPAGY